MNIDPNATCDKKAYVENKMQCFKGFFGRFIQGQVSLVEPDKYIFDRKEIPTKRLKEDSSIGFGKEFLAKLQDPPKVLAKNTSFVYIECMMTTFLMTTFQCYLPLQTIEKVLTNRFKGKVPGYP